LILDPVPEIKKLFCFLFDVESIEGTVLEERIEKAVEKSNLSNYEEESEEETSQQDL